MVVRAEFLKTHVSNPEMFEVSENRTARRLYRDLVAYFSGEKVTFNYRVDIRSEFVRKVLDVVRKIDYGKTLTYGDIARKLGTSPRAVGYALKANPAPVIIPCHRVVAKNGIGGFSQGVEIKLELLRLEGAI